MATSVLGLKTFTASDPVDYNEINDNYNKIDNGVKTALQGRAAHNLLDNSWFVNPVNQRGFSSTTSTGESMGIDRWLFSVNSGGSISLNSSGLVCQNANLTQRIESKLLDSSKEYTQVFWLSDGTPVFPTKWIDFNYSSGVGRVVYYGITGTIAAAALYEGSYTADTLPAYVPKGYAAELAECQRYYQTRDISNYQVIVLGDELFFAVEHPGMRIAPSITIINPISNENGSITNLSSGGKFATEIRTITKDRTIAYVATGTSGKSYGVSYTASADL